MKIASVFFMAHPCKHCSVKCVTFPPLSLCGSLSLSLSPPAEENIVGERLIGLNMSRLSKSLLSVPWQPA